MKVHAYWIALARMQVYVTTQLRLQNQEKCWYSSDPFQVWDKLYMRGAELNTMQCLGSDY